MDEGESWHIGGVLRVLELSVGASARADEKPRDKPPADLLSREG